MKHLSPRYNPGNRTSITDITSINLASANTVATTSTGTTRNSLVLQILGNAYPTTSNDAELRANWQNPNNTWSESDKYITVLPFDINNDDMLSTNQYVPYEDPSYVVLSLSNDSHVSCKFITPCGTLSAHLSIPCFQYICSYSKSNQTIQISNDMPSLRSSDENSMYKVLIYRNFGLVKEIYFNSSEQEISVNATGFSNGSYYINILNEENVVLTKQTLIVNK